MTSHYLIIAAERASARTEKQARLEKILAEVEAAGRAYRASRPTTKPPYRGYPLLCTHELSPESLSARDAYWEGIIGKMVEQNARVR